MPIYEYGCQECGEQVTAIFSTVSSAQEAQVVCTRCGSDMLERLVSRVSFRGFSQPGRVEASRTVSSEASARHGAPSDQSLHDASSETLARTMQRAAGNGRTKPDEAFREVAGRLANGESAHAIERSLRHRVGEVMETH